MQVVWVVWLGEGRARTEGLVRSARPVGAVRALPGGAAGRETGKVSLKFLQTNFHSTKPL